MATVSLGTAFLTPAVLGYNRVATQAEESTARLASGNRILRAGDDSTSLSIATRLQTQIAGLKQASKNVAFGDTLAEVASEGLEQIQAALDEAADIAEQANSAILAEQDRNVLQLQLSDLLAEIDRVVTDTTFNNQSLLDGTFEETEIRVGSGEEDTVTVSISDLRVAELFQDGPPDVSTQANAATAEDRIEDAITVVGNTIGALEGVQSQLFAAADNIQSTLGGVNQANDALARTDTAEESRALTKATLLLDIGSSVIAQTQRLSSDLLSVLEFTIDIGENTRQSELPEAEDDTESSQSDTETNAPSTAEAT